MPCFYDILGIRVLAATPRQAVPVIDAHLGKGPAIVAFLNAHVSNEAARDARLAAILHRALVLNDGAGLDIAARLLHGHPFPANLNGTDLVPEFLARTRHRFRIHAVGSAPGVAARAVERLRAAAPRHEYVGSRDGFFDPADPDIMREIRGSGADLVLAAMGTPRQELWADALVRAGGPSVLCVGGLLDFVSGEKPRAPRLVQRLRLEWLFRMVLEPKRLWRRYVIGNPRFILRVLRARFRPAARPRDRTDTP